jgi:N-carbamoyl-L-amino-acid hydrolase
MSSIEPDLRATSRVSEARLWQRHMAMAAIGATAKGGVNRQALSAEDAQARKLLVSWAASRKFDVATDAIGNLFIRRAGSDPSARPVLTGSHMDTQPTGGRFDGIYGVLAGFEVLEALEDAGVATRRPVEVVAWTNEEGNRFQPGAMGSAVFAGTYDLAKMLGVKDQKGVSLADALAETQRATPVPSRGQPGFAIDGYVEAHIEQGPRLEAAGRTIGVVTLVQGQRRYAVEVLGEEAHSGTTPRAARKDAFLAAVDIVAALAPAMAAGDDGDTVRFTVGRFEVYPGSPSTVPARVNFIIDLRHPDPQVLDDRKRRIFELVEQHKGRCNATVAKITEVPPTPFAPAVIDLVRRGAGALGLSHMDMPSGAGHDAMHIAPLCPSGMIFVPCLKGISHNEAESATPADLAAGTRVLAATLVALADQKGTEREGAL